MQYIWNINNFFIPLQKIINDMFKNYDLLYSKFCVYLKTDCAQLNASDMQGGFFSIETLIAHLYDSNMPYVYSVKYSEDEDKLIMQDSSLEYKDAKLKTISEYTQKEWSFIDSYRKMKHFVLFDINAYILTDYGIISMFGTARNGLVKSISSIKIWIDSDLHKQEIEDFLNATVVEMPSTNKQKNVTICTQGSYGIKKTELEIKPFNCDLNKNYNDDIPYDKLVELVNSDEQELILLHGEPGTGKTSIIKKLINDNPNVEFIYFDFNLLTSFSDSKIFDFLVDHKNHVLIIEDCEKLFMDRNNGNQYLNTMLNLTDGMIGEAFAIKFICTFNCPTNKIDKAVMREGRLSLIYEFKKLSLEKTKAFFPNATEPMTLAQLYHTEDNGNKKVNKKIGF